MLRTACTSPTKFIASAVLGLLFVTSPARAQEFMTQAELLATIPGHTIQAKTDKGVPWAQTYSAGKKKGTIAVNFNGEMLKSKWYVKGDQWCEDWGDGKACWDVEQVDANSLRMYENGKPKKNLWKLK